MGYVFIIRNRRSRLGKRSKHDRRHQRDRRAAIRWVKKFDGQMVMYKNILEEARRGPGKRTIGLIIGSLFCPWQERKKLKLATDSDIVLDRLRVGTNEYERSAR